MALCVLIPAWAPLPLGPYFIWFNMFYTSILGFDFCRLFLIGGLVLSMAWFRPRKEEPKTPLPRSIPIALAVLLVFMGLTWWTFWQIALYPEGALANPVFHLPITFWWPLGGDFVGGNLITFLLEWSAIPLAVLGIVALVKARTRDRRWRAVYFLSLSVMMLAFCVLNLLSSMDATAASDMWRTPTQQYCAVITAVGLVGTGVALC